MGLETPQKPEAGRGNLEEVKTSRSAWRPPLALSFVSTLPNSWLELQSLLGSWCVQRLFDSRALEP